MRKIGYYAVKIAAHFKKNGHEILCDYFRKGGAQIGKNCFISSNLDLCEKHLLNIGDNVIISSEVLFVTHDASYTMFGDKTRSLFGSIKIGNNCFVGERATIMYGVELADNTIVAAGAVVTKSVEIPGYIIGGNPARVIGKIEDFKKSSDGRGMLLADTLGSTALNDKRFVTRKPMLTDK